MFNLWGEKLALRRRRDFRRMIEAGRGGSGAGPTPGEVLARIGVLLLVSLTIGLAAELLANLLTR
jgi:hypothetical protein